MICCQRYGDTTPRTVRVLFKKQKRQILHQEIFAFCILVRITQSAAQHLILKAD
jgi:hypothetical protein